MPQPAHYSELADAVSETFMSAMWCFFEPGERHEWQLEDLTALFMEWTGATKEDMRDEGCVLYAMNYLGLIREYALCSV